MIVQFCETFSETIVKNGDAHEINCIWCNFYLKLLFFVPQFSFPKHIALLRIIIHHLRERGQFGILFSTYNNNSLMHIHLFNFLLVVYYIHLVIHFKTCHVKRMLEITGFDNISKERRCKKRTMFRLTLPKF